jgi:hypothetical protein
VSEKINDEFVYGEKQGEVRYILDLLAGRRIKNVMLFNFKDLQLTGKFHNFVCH